MCFSFFFLLMSKIPFSRDELERKWGKFHASFWQEKERIFPSTTWNMKTATGENHNYIKVQFTIPSASQSAKKSSSNHHAARAPTSLFHSSSRSPFIHSFALELPRCCSLILYFFVCAWNRSSDEIYIHIAAASEEGGSCSLREQTEQVLYKIWNTHFRSLSTHSVLLCIIPRESWVGRPQQKTRQKQQRDDSSLVYFFSISSSFHSLHLHFSFLSPSLPLDVVESLKHRKKTIQQKST